MTKYFLIFALVVVGLVAVGSVGATADAPAVGAVAQRRESAAAGALSLRTGRGLGEGQPSLDLRWLSARTGSLGPS